MHADPLEKLLEHACPSIKYRIRLEILGESESSETMVELQGQILQDPTVVDILSWQQPDGWLGWSFHGAKGIEAGIRILCEKGVRQNHQGLTNALLALEKYPERLDRGIGKVGKVLDAKGCGGSLMIRATVFAYAGVENKPFLREQIETALDGMRVASTADSIKDIAEEYRGKLVFRPGVRWPSIYHLRLLASTQSWYTAENRKLVTNAIKRLIELSPIPDIYVKSKSQLITPASFCMHDFNPAMDQMDNAHWMMWFHRMECLARLGVVAAIPELQKQTNILDHMLDADGNFTKKLAHPYFTKWGVYPGMMLETDWDTQEHRIFDLTFRSRLILHYAESKVTKHWPT